MLSGKHWPAHPHPHTGECLSSWLIRCAHENGLKAQTFCELAFGQNHQIWNRDIDRLAPRWLLKELQLKTGTTRKDAFRTTLKLYEKRLFPQMHSASQLRWVTPKKLYHRKPEGYGQQFCPRCLREDQDPYYRLQWRLALYTFCPKHHRMLLDRCPVCSAPVAYHRIELGKPNQYKNINLSTCWHCGFDLALAESSVPELVTKTTADLWSRLLKAIDRQFINSGPINYDRIIVLHQTCKILNSTTNKAQKLASHIFKSQPNRGQLPTISEHVFEALPIQDRHNVLLLAWWITSNTTSKLKHAIDSKALRLNHLYKDLSRSEKMRVLNFLAG